MHKVSVIIPAYNCMYHIPEAIESVLNQTYEYFEMIIVDDGSTDNTKTVLAKYAKNYPEKIRCIYTENRGAASARNVGLKHAKGEYIAFLDSDDVWLPHKLERQLAVFHERPEVDMIFTNSDIVDSKGAPLNKLYVKPSEFEIKPEKMFEGILAIRNFIPFSSILLKRSVVEDIGLLDENLKSSHDADWLLRIVKKYKAVGINEALAKYKIHDNAISRNIILRQHDRIKIIKDNMAKYPHETHSITKRLKTRISQSYYEWGYAEFERNNLKAAREKFLESIGCNPFLNSLIYFYILACLMPVHSVDYLKKLKRKLLRLA